MCAAREIFDYVAHVTWHTTFLVSLDLLCSSCYCTIHAEDVLHVFPYYNKLNAIWKGIPSFNSELVLSKPMVNLAESLLQIVKKTHAAMPEEEMELQDY